ncbi:hypothetical protein CKAH01_10948 [Colletotrichum kahawae]|uniref:Uncharacterized protein n=1 Tax=Colletotrichum kahawae TaxID=34407 RepID=A0AAE0CWW4_COLKA|nr:hypothetical protein CKAH01_10948 [Colletotrichum kahawae]
MTQEKRPAPDDNDDAGDANSSKAAVSATKRRRESPSENEEIPPHPANNQDSGVVPRGANEPCMTLGRKANHTVAIHAGPSKEIFFIYAHLLMDCNEFRQQLEILPVVNGVTEIHLPTEDPDVISLMVYWCTRNQLLEWFKGADSTNTHASPAHASQCPTTAPKGVIVTTVGNRSEDPAAFVPDALAWSKHLGKMHDEFISISDPSVFGWEFYQLKVLKLAIMASKKGWPVLFQSAMKTYCETELGINRVYPVSWHIEAVCAPDVPKEVSGFMMDYCRFSLSQCGMFSSFVSSNNVSPSMKQFLDELCTAERCTKAPSTHPLHWFAPPSP